MRLLWLLLAIPVTLMVAWSGILLLWNPPRFLRFYDRFFDLSGRSKDAVWRNRIDSWEWKFVGLGFALSGLFFAFLTAAALVKLLWPSH